MHIYRFLKKKTIQKGPLFPIFKKSSSIHKNNHALIASIVLKKIYFQGICAHSKKRLILRVLARLLKKNKFYALKMLEKQNLTHPKAAKLATLAFISIPSLSILQMIITLADVGRRASSSFA